MPVCVMPNSPRIKKRFGAGAARPSRTTAGDLAIAARWSPCPSEAPRPRRGLSRLQPRNVPQRPLGGQTAPRAAAPQVVHLRRTVRDENGTRQAAKNASRLVVADPSFLGANFVDLFSVCRFLIELPSFFSFFDVTRRGVTVCCGRSV